MKPIVRWIILLAGLSAAPLAQTPLVDITTVNPRILVEMKYATEDNFLKQRVYTDTRCYLLPSVAAKLDEAQKLLEKDGLGLKVYDCHRPVEVQKKMWTIVPDDRYVANPYQGGSLHNRGVAVDITLVDKDGKELEMPTSFDSFSPRASHGDAQSSATARANRLLLKLVLEKVGLEAMPTEWWHYGLPNGKSYPILER